MLARRLEIVEADLESAVSREREMRLREHDLRRSEQSWKARAGELQQQVDYNEHGKKRGPERCHVDVAIALTGLAQESHESILLKLTMNAWRLSRTISSSKINSLSHKKRRGPERCHVGVAIALTSLAQEAHDSILLKLTLNVWRLSRTSSSSVKQSEDIQRQTDSPLLEHKEQAIMTPRRLESSMDDCTEDGPHEKTDGGGLPIAATPITPSCLRSSFYALGTPPSELRECLKAAAASLEEEQARAKALELQLDNVREMHRSQLEEAEQRERSLRQELDDLEEFYESRRKDHEAAQKDACSQTAHHDGLAEVGINRAEKLECSLEQNAPLVRRLQTQTRLEVMQRRIDLLQQSTQHLRCASEKGENKSQVSLGQQMLNLDTDRNFSVVCA